MLRFALSNGQIINDLRRARKPAPGFREEFHSAFRIFQRAEEQLGKAQICTGMIRIDQQTLLIICGYFGEFRFRFVQPVLALKRSRFIIQHLGKQIIRLVFLRMLFNDLLEQFNRFAALIC